MTDAGDASGSHGDVLLVDVANVVGSRADGWWRDRVGATRRLVRDVRGGDLTDRRVVLVLEGRAVAAADDVDPGPVELVCASGSGDDEIARLVASYVGDGERVAVVTADRELRNRVHELGGRTLGPTWLLTRIGPRRSEEPPAPGTRA